jgi:hypothetical protein
MTGIELIAASRSTCSVGVGDCGGSAAERQLAKRNAKMVDRNMKILEQRMSQTQLVRQFTRWPYEPASDSSAVSLSVVVCIVASLFGSCLGSRQFQTIPAEGPPPTAQHLELQSPVAVATLHFPAGLYTLYATDSTGYYYAAPQEIIQHTGGGSVPHQGGVYVLKRDPNNIRGYVFVAGALTHVGNFSRVEYRFR